METKEELLKKVDGLLESFVFKPDVFLSSALKKEKGTEKYVGNGEEYHEFMENVRKYLLEKNLYKKEVSGEFEKLIERKPDRTVLNRVLDILNNC